MRQLQIGDVNVTIIDLGELSFKLKDVENIAEKEWRPKHNDLFENSILFPSQSVLVSIKDFNLIVDPGDYELFSSLDPAYIPENYRPPPGILTQLGDINVSEKNVTHVVITHAHYDHYAGVTRRKDDGSFSPTFSSATFFLSRLDYEDKRIQEALSDPHSADSHTIGVLQKLGLLKLVDGYLRLCQEIEIFPSPGESPGHQIVRIHSKGETLYCIGDLFHHEIEVENPTWMASWDEPVSNLRSRLELIATAINENAFVLAAHMPLGKLERVGSTKARFIPD